MTSDEINTIIKRMCLNQQLNAAALTQAQTDAINLLGHALVAAAPESFEKKVSLGNGGSHVFTEPSDMLMLKRLWDYDGNVGTVSGAADNGEGLIRITHNIVIPDDPDDMEFPYIFPFTFTEGVDAVATIHDVGGCTEANGTWGVTYVDSTHIDLYGSTFANAYTSGGKIFIERSDTYLYPLSRITSKYETADDETEFFYKNGKIIVNDPNFRNDLITLYRFLPSTLAEIPSRLHFGVYAYGVINLIEFPQRKLTAEKVVVDSPEYATKRKNYDMAKSLWDQAISMAQSFKPVMPTNNIADMKSPRRTKRWL